MSALSNDVSKATAAAPADTTAPAAIKDLTIAGQTGSTITLMWPATGDDGNSGQASSYEVRYRAKVKSPDTPTVTMTASDHNWSSSSIFPQTMTPKPAGQQETLTVTGLVPGRIYGFAIFAKDEAGNTSELSNSIDTMTTWDSSGNSAGLAVEAYDDMNLNVFRGRKVFSQLWIGSNDLPVETTTFGVRATGVVTPQYSQTYTFYTATSANDGVRLWVNGQLLIDTWSSGTSAERSATIALTANQPYEIRAELKALDINGYLKVSWSSPSQAKEVVKTPKLAALPDTIAPSAIAGMTATTLSASSVQLAFTTPGDDDLFLPGLSRAWGLVSAYDVRYSTAAITAGNWSSAVSANILALPQGGSDTVTVNGLRPGTTYHFAVKGVDEAGNLGAISNDVTATTSGTVDNTAPAAVANLSATNSSLQKVQLSWTAPGDDGATGTAVSYDIRYSTAAINSVNFDAASEAFGEPAPTAAGTGQTMTLGGLSPGTSYYFAMKTTDEVGNVSAISNLPSSLTTTAAPAGGYVVGGASTLDLHASLAQTGNIYYATYNTSQGSPSAASVKAAAQGATGGALVKNGTIVVAVGDVGSDLTRVIGTLPENAAYYTYWVGETTGLGTVYSSVNALQIRQKETSFTSAALGGSAYYLAYQPEGAYRDPNANYPLLVFLHGYGERGNNELYKVKTNGPPKLIAQGQEMPFIVVSPQLPSAYGKWDIPGYIDDVVKDAGKRYAIDPKRIYVTGLSIGGGGAYYYTQEHPEKVAAVIPVAGKNEGVPSFIRYDNAFRMNNVPMWAFSNAVDPTVNRGLTEEILYWMALGSVTPNPQPIFTVYQAEGHNSWDAAYGNPAIYTWLLGKTKP
ncbi:MAG: fibronectin type III domain-containing protein [Paenibacillaceae bacterium]|nr:fibronectin type III domain-containing protein [Paenibacillaceae bacterium]